MRRWASAAPVGRREARRSEDFSGLHEIALAGSRPGASTLGSGQMRMLRLRTGWARAVGAPLSEVARLRACTGERLLVEVPDALWKREMDRLKPRILEALAREVPCAPVSDLCFSIRGSGREAGGPVKRRAPAAPAGADPDAGQAPGTLPEGLSGALARVEDPALRGRLGEVMGRSLSCRTALR